MIAIPSKPGPRRELEPGRGDTPVNAVPRTSGPAAAVAGFIDGRPIVMNYAVMYAYAIDRDSGQFKAPFNQIKNEARVSTCGDMTVVTPDSDTPYSLTFMDLGPNPWCCPAMEPYVGTTAPAISADANLFALSPAGAWYAEDFAATTKIRDVAHGARTAYCRWRRLGKNEEWVPLGCEEGTKPLVRSGAIPSSGGTGAATC
jgi:hypothetical protein